EVACLSALSGSGLAPQLCAAEPRAEIPWVLYHHLPGEPWARDPAAVARLLAKVHRRPPPAELPAGPDGGADLLRQTRALLALCPQGAAELAALQPAGAVPPAAARRLIHGDPVPGNIVMRGARAALIDWQCPAAGDPAEDLALFASPAMQLVYRGAPLSAAELEVFLAAYPDRAVVRRYLSLRPWFHWRMAAYCLLQAGRGHAAYAQGLALERAALPAYSSAR
ncbi:MAG: phosphotransferase family protein, partial [Pseudodonghicola sp.]